MQKSFLIKVYTAAGRYLTTWEDASFLGYRAQKNGGLGEGRIVLARRFEDFGEYADVTLYNRVYVYAAGGSLAAMGTLIYSGYISRYAPYLDENREGVEVTCLGFGTRLACTLLKSASAIELKTDTSSGFTTGGSASAATVTKLVQSTIDRFRAETLAPLITYTDSSIASTTNSLTYTFNGKTYREVLELCRKTAPPDWFYYVGPDNVLQFQPKPATPTHYFTYPTHFKRITVDKSMEEVVNRVLFTNGSVGTILKLYSDATSGNLYGDRWEILTDSRVTQIGTADNFGASRLAEAKEAAVRITMTISDAYPIETIQPGHTCAVQGFNAVAAQTFEANATIHAVTYSPDSAILEIGGLAPSLARITAEHAKRLERQEESGRGATYTS
jgi:hypothetical protein